MIQEVDAEPPLANAEMAEIYEEFVTQIAAISTTIPNDNLCYLLTIGSKLYRRVIDEQQAPLSAAAPSHL